jgi:DNA-binding PadR family transcriptional regulator
LQPCLLLLLRERSDHGYDLVNRLRVLHAVDGDAGAVYRALRGLEKAGMVRSSWQTSEAGPARRTYQVTPLGVATLDRQVEVLEETHRTLHLFRERYERLAVDAAEGGASDRGSAAEPHGSNCIVAGCPGPHGSIARTGVVGVGTAADGAVGAGAVASSGNGAHGNGSRGNGAHGNGSHGNGSHGSGSFGNGSYGNGSQGNGSHGIERRSGDGGGTSGGADGGSGSRGVRPPRVPGQRSGG